MSDIVERLREGPGDWQQEAADEIERLRQLVDDPYSLHRREIERLQQQNAKLREELSVWLKCYQEEKRKREELVQRVREVLGDG